MEINQNGTKNLLSISQNGVFSFQWKIRDFRLQISNYITSPGFYYKRNKYPWFLKLHYYLVPPDNFFKLDLYHDSTEEIDLEFTITVAKGLGKPFYANRVSFSNFSRLQPVNLLPNIKLPTTSYDYTVNISCTIQVTSGLDLDSQTNSLTSISDQHPGGDDSPDLESLKQLSIDFKRMLIQAKNTDVTIRVEDITIEAHRTILCARSPVLCSMFEHTTLEAINNGIEVRDIRAPIMKKLILYLYSGEKGCLQYEEACELYYAADKYEILNLREACMKDLLSLLDVNNACPMLSMAHSHSDDVFKDRIMDFISRNFNAISNTDSWIELTDCDTKLAALLMRHCARAMTK